MLIFWCGEPDLSLDDEVARILEGGLRVGQWFDKWLASQENPERWPYRVADVVLDNVGDAKLAVS